MSDQIVLAVKFEKAEFADMVLDLEVHTLIMPVVLQNF